MHALLNALLPWEFSPTALIVAAAALAAYLRGWRLARARAGVLRPAAFLAGVLLPYAFFDTRLEFFALHLFWLQRIEHLVLHHLAPFLIAVSAPLELLERGTPRALRDHVLRPLAANRALRAMYRLVQRPVLASVLFVGLIYFWLIPSVQLATMLSEPLYQLMNASMLLDGILFWWLMVGPEASGGIHVSYGVRMLILVLITLPQTLLGAFITFHHGVLYPSFSICGRAGSIGPLLDQQLGGLNTWVPPGMMSAIGLAVVAARAMREQRGLKASPAVSGALTRAVAGTGNAALSIGCGRPLPSGAVRGTGSR